MADKRAIGLLIIGIAIVSPVGALAQGEADDPQANVTNETAAGSGGASESSDPDDIESLVVTARRRPELLQETPVAATVLGGALLEQRGVDSIEKIGAYVPNLNSFSGVQHQGSFYSRGVGQRDAVVTLDPGVGLYVDDVYVARAHGALLPTVDVERVEVLRGPQGTLYGKNTIGGAIKLVSEKPSPEPYIAGMLGGGDFDTVRGSATLNAPIIAGKLNSRITFTGHNSEGYNKNIASNDRWYNDDDLKALRAQLRLLPGEDVTVDLSGHYSTQEEMGRGSKCRISDPTVASIIPFGFAAGCAAADNASTYRFASELRDHYLLETYGTSLVGAWEVGPALGLFDSVDLKSVSAFQQQEVDDGFLDLDASANPFLYQVTVDPQRQTQWSQEIQGVAAAFDDRMRLTAGLYGFWEDTGNGDVLSNSFGARRLERVEIRNDSYAAYGQASVTPIEWVELTGGVRGTWETKRAKRTIDFNQLGSEPRRERADQSFDQVTPMASIALKAQESWIEDTPISSGILYYTYSEGYKSGGFATRRDPSVSSIPDFDAEKLGNHELGFKLDLLGGHVLFNTALFYSEYRDIQLTVARVNQNSPAFQPDIGSSIDNAGKATIQGLEIELITKPWDALVVRGSLGVTDAKYDEFIDQTWDINPGTGLVENLRPLDRSNEKFFNVPELTFDASVEYPIALNRFGGGDLGTLTPLVHVYYRSDTDTHFTAAGYASRKFRQDAYALLDLRLAWDLPDDRTSIAVFADNVTDTHYFDSSVDLTNTLGIGGVYYAPPRMVGAEIRYRWQDPSFF